MSQNTETTDLSADGVESATSGSRDVASASPESAGRSTDGASRSASTDVDSQSATAESDGEEPPKGGSDGEARSDELSLDHTFGILKNQRRRRVLRYLHETDGQVSLSEVAEQIAAQENDKSVKQISSAERKRVYVGLYQCHLPKMDSMEIVSFNKPRGTIELGEHAPDVYDYIGVDDGDADPPWHEYSIALSLCGAGVLVGAVAVQPMTAIPIIDIAVALIIASFLSYALVSHTRERAETTTDEGATEAVVDEEGAETVADQGATATATGERATEQ